MIVCDLLRISGNFDRNFYPGRTCYIILKHETHMKDTKGVKEIRISSKFAYESARNFNRNFHPGKTCSISLKTETVLNDARHVRSREIRLSIRNVLAAKTGLPFQKFSFFRKFSIGTIQKKSCSFQSQPESLGIVKIYTAAVILDK